MSLDMFLEILSVFACFPVFIDKVKKNYFEAIFQIFDPQINLSFGHVNLILYNIKPE